MVAVILVSYGLLRPHAKLSYPDQAHKLWSDVDRKERRS